MKIVQKMILSAISLTAVLGTSAFAADLSNWAVPGYQSASEAGLVSYSVVSNNLKDSITREEFCELAMNLYKKLTNESLPERISSPFEDTDSVAVAQAYNYGIVNGTSDTTFTPDRLVTREEMAKMLVSTLTASEIVFNIADGADMAYVSAFEDGNQTSSWAMSSVNTALNYELLTGMSDTVLNPLGATSREQAIVSVNRSYEKFKSKTYSNISVPTILLPKSGAVITDKEFDVKWDCDYDYNVRKYHVIIKDENATPVVLKDVMSNKIGITNKTLSNGNYTIIIGAVLYDGSEVYSLPVDFTYNYTKKVNTPVTTPRPSVESIDPDEIPSSVDKVKPDEKEYLSDNPDVQDILDYAEKFLGTPYVWGGTTPDGFDCSGFVQYVFGKNGYNITRTTYTQWDNDGTPVDREDLLPGDLVYFGSGDDPSHVGIYVGDGKMIHSPRTGDVIRYSTIESGYYDDCYLGARRIVK